MIPTLNRRRTGHFRLPIRVPAVLDAIDGRAGRGEAQDLSPGGALLCPEQGIPPGTPVRVTLRLSRRPPLTLIGTVAWTRPHPDFPGWALGIRFDADLPGERWPRLRTLSILPGAPPRQTRLRLRRDSPPLHRLPAVWIVRSGLGMQQ